jgi:hypothetical protein
MAIEIFRVKWKFKMIRQCFFSNIKFNKNRIIRSRVRWKMITLYVTAAAHEHTFLNPTTS